MYNFERLMFSSAITWLLSVLPVNCFKILRCFAKSIFLFQSAILWMVAEILNSFKRWSNRCSAGRSKEVLFSGPASDSHMKTRSSSFFQTGSILIIQASCIINCDTTSNGSSFLGSKMLTGQTSM
uniref:Putative secreted protein n=1 Tax=Anopheles triannulatus TaxID=58253 RepID=A0A2M4B2A9_9DIPT